MACIAGYPGSESVRCDICNGGTRPCICGKVTALSHMGWACPVCHKGNAPGAKTCGHCAKQEIHGATDNDYLADLRKAGDMRPERGD